MTIEEAIKYLIKPVATSTEIGEEKQKEFEAYNMAIEALADRPTGEWIIHDEVKNIYGGIYIECSECGTKFVTQTLEDEHFCRNCGTRMTPYKGGDDSE